MATVLFQERTGALVGLLLLFAVARIYELLRSRAHLREWKARVRSIRERLFPWMVALHVAFFLIQPLEAWLIPAEWGGPLTMISAAIVVVALFLRIWTLKTLGSSWNVRLVQGQPIITNGPYRLIRHPNYLVVFLELLFVPLIFHLYFSAACLTLVNLRVLTVRIRAEEQLLRARPEWVRAMSSKPSGLPWIR